MVVKALILKWDMVPASETTNVSPTPPVGGVGVPVLHLTTGACLILKVAYHLQRFLILLRERFRTYLNFKYLNSEVYVK